jgi:hypothetical protein
MQAHLRLYDEALSRLYVGCIKALRQGAMAALVRLYIQALRQGAMAALVRLYIQALRQGAMAALVRLYIQVALTRCVRRLSVGVLNAFRTRIMLIYIHLVNNAHLYR